jgi:hypothetical protein
VLVAAHGAGFLGHLLLDILVEFLERHDRVPIQVRGTVEPPDEGSAAAASANPHRSWLRGLDLNQRSFGYELKDVTGRRSQSYIRDAGPREPRDPHQGRPTSLPWCAGMRWSAPELGTIWAQTRIPGNSLAGN